MELSEQLKTIRKLRNFTQETVAEKLGISTYSYAKIERGETDVKYSRLQQIAKIMGIELEELFSMDDKKVLNLINDNNTACNNVVNLTSIEQVEIKYEQEKTQLIIEQQQKEIDYLKQQVNLLNQMINMLKPGK
jgi:transcriptional regulator with XRE-family HTH domain